MFRQGVGMMVKWKPAICLVVFMVGAIHAMTHVEFGQLTTQLFDDTDRLFEVICDYVKFAFIKLGFSRSNGGNKATEIYRHYDLLRKRSEPLVKIFRRDLKLLIYILKRMESVRLLRKFLYTYFRDSAISLVSRLKVIYKIP